MCSGEPDSQAQGAAATLFSNSTGTGTSSGSLLQVGIGFHGELTGRENIYLNGAILGMRKAQIDRRFDEITAFAEVDMFLDTPVKHRESGPRLWLATGH